MRKSTEIRKNITDVQNSMNALQKEGKIKEAHALLENLNELKMELELAVAEESLTNLDPTPAGPKNEINIESVFNKLVLGKAVTKEEREFYNEVTKTGQVEAIDTKGGFIVPPHRFNEIIEAKRKRNPLKQYCNVIPVNSNHGTLPTSAVGDAMLKPIKELEEILKSDEEFGELEFKTEDYGDIVECSEPVLEDTNVDLIGLIKRRFAIKAVNCENDEIMKIMETSEKVPGTTWDALVTALNVKLDPAISDNAMIFTNQTSYDWLDREKDGNGRPLLTPDLADPSVMRFRGKRIVRLPDSLMTPGATKDFFVGDLEEAVSFFDRKGISIAMSKEAGFTRNSALLRAIERFDVIAVDTKALVKVMITPAGAKSK